MEKDPLFNFRQPLVTAGGIILGFILSFATSLVKRNNRSDLVALLILLFILVGICLLIISLYRILNRDYNHENAQRYYRKTLNYFLIGVILSFVGGVLKMTHTFFIS